MSRMIETRKLSSIIILLTISFLLALTHYRQFIETVVVDGNRHGPSALKNQSHEEDLIDGYNTKDCGISDPDSEDPGFVNQAREGQFPWLVSFQVKGMGKSRPMHFCMGSLISDKWILSAAHCFAPDQFKDMLDRGSVIVTGGSTNAFSEKNAKFEIKRIFYHSQYDHKAPIGFDISLIELKDKAKFKSKYDGELPYLNSVCLPKQGKEFTKGQAVKIAGWGDTESKDPNSKPDRLLTTDLLITDAEECAKIFAKNMKKVKEQFLKFKDFLCASYKASRDACQGDSGGSMLEYADGRAVAVGIVSYGKGCATTGTPGVYERVSSLMPWIKDITQNKDNATVYYTVLERGKNTINKNKETKGDKSKGDGVAKGEKGKKDNDKKSEGKSKDDKKKG